jgi:diadenosine tetraphosphatase ApaH/serine/threonine PP2A family protein phosphatase
MRLAILADIHANREALTAVLADMAERGISRTAVLGDIVGYGPDPAWCADRIAALVDQGALAVQGNHDAAIGKPDPGLCDTARNVIGWTRAQLSAAQKSFLAALPLTLDTADTLLVHASAHAPQDWLYVRNAERARPSFRACRHHLILCGHTHVPLLVCADATGRCTEIPIRHGQPLPLLRQRRWLAVVGSVGQPRDGVAQAGYAVLDQGANTLTFRRVPYDCAETARKTRAAGLPEPLARRLTFGA